MRSRSRLNPRPVVAGHLRALGGESGVITRRDLLEQVGVPAGIGVVAAYFGLEISGTTAAAILTLSGIFAAFFFQLSVQLLDRAANWAEGDPEPGKDTSDYACLLEDLSASTTYAALVAAMCSAAALAVGITQQGWQERVLAAVVVGLLAHLATTLLLVAVRVYLLTRARLNRARTGRDRTP